MVSAVFSGFILALLAPCINRLARRWAGILIAILPASLFGYFLCLLKEVNRTGEKIFTAAWIPSLNINWTFLVDGWSLLFAIIVSGIGALIFIYAGEYLRGHVLLGRFYSFLLMFMASMLGLVLSGNILLLFVFWELTSLSSFFLIGFDHERPAARDAALQALLVTGLGGLALLVGFLLLGQITGSYDLAVILDRGQMVRSSPFYAWTFALIVFGTVTKSAQVPFHFWLPSAMEAPTPVSAYLHSATMVKAGIYLLARLFPVLGGTALWHHTLMTFGLLTMFIGACQSYNQTDLKRILAYSTVSVLGLLVFQLGIGSDLAVKAAVVFLLAHALSKGALFLIAGAVSHSTGLRDSLKLSGLGRAMPFIAMAAVLAALSKMGVPPFGGFIGKEMIYKAKVSLGENANFLLGLTVLANMLLVAAIFCVGIRPFFGRQPECLHAHRAPFGMWFGPLFLAVLGLIFGVYPLLIQDSLISPAVKAVLQHSLAVDLTLWHGFNKIVLLSAATLVGGVVFFLLRFRIRKIVAGTDVCGRVGPQNLYHLGLAGLQKTAEFQTRVLQSGRQRYYLLIIFTTALFFVGGRLFFSGIDMSTLSLANIRFYEMLLCLAIMGAALAMAFATTFLAGIIAAGVVGYCIALLYVMGGAPDLAMTQFIVETLTVILLLALLHKFPPIRKITGPVSRLRDAVIAGIFGVVMTGLVLAYTVSEKAKTVSQFFIDHSLPEAHGRNIVNVILVDFRALDTMGEITVLAISGIGVFAILRLAAGRMKRA